MRGTENRTYELVEKATNKLVTTGTFYGPKARKQAGAWLMGWNRRQSGRYELREKKEER